MYNRGDKLLCISTAYGLEINKVYTVLRYRKSLYETDCVLIYGSGLWYSVERFIPYDYRKEKILKIKERINGI